MKNEDVKMGYYDCKICKPPATIRSAEKLYAHFEAKHKGLLEGTGYTAKQYLYHSRSTLPPERIGRCKWSGCKSNEKDKYGNYLPKKTAWDETKARYEFTCCPEHAKRWNEEKKQQMVKKYGRPHLMNDLEHQKKLMAGRKGSGIYRFRDGHEIEYLFAYEKDFLHYLETQYPQNLAKSLKKEGMDLHDFKFKYGDMKSCMDKDVMIFYTYIMNNSKHFYIPDMYYEPYDLVIEIKAGGVHPNTHPGMMADNTEKNHLKLDAVMRARSHNFIKITDKRYDSFENIMDILRNRFLDREIAEGTKLIVIDD